MTIHKTSISKKKNRKDIFKISSAADTTLHTDTELTLDTSGYVGIGTTGPTRHLNLYTGSSGNVYFKMSNSTSGITDTCGMLPIKGPISLPTSPSVQFWINTAISFNSIVLDES